MSRYGGDLMRLACGHGEPARYNFTKPVAGQAFLGPAPDMRLGFFATPGGRGIDIGALNVTALWEIARAACEARL